MIINPSEHDDFYQRQQRLECVHCSSAFIPYTAIKIIMFGCSVFTAMSNVCDLGFVFPLHPWGRGVSAHELWFL